MKTDKISLLLISSILLTVMTAAITHYMSSLGAERQARIFRTYDNIRTSTELLSLMKDAETGERGYLITGDTAYLKPFYHAQRIIPLVLDSMQTLAADDSLQKSLLELQIKPMTHEKLRQLSAVIGVRDVYGMDSSFVYLRSGESKACMDNLRELLHTFTEREKSDLVYSLRDLDTTRLHNNSIRYSSFFIIALVSFLALLTIRQKQLKNVELVKALRQANRLLEEKVESRTRELQIKNELEEQLNDELRHTLEELQSFYDALQIRNEKSEDTLHAIRDLYDYAPCGYHSIDENGTFLRVNAMELLWLGYTSEEVVGKMKFTDLLTADGRALFTEMFDEFKETGIVNNLEFELIRKDGSTFPVLLSATALYDDDGRFLMSRATSVDISDRKYMEQELREANEQLRHVNEEKNHFLGMTAHDLKSPLNGVLGLIALIKNETSLTAQQSEYLKYIEDVCLNMKTLIMNLLDINRIEQGLTAIIPDRVGLPTVLEHPMLSLGEHARKKNILLKVEDNAGPVTLYTDANALGRVIENLLSNAIKFSPAGTTVALRTELLKGRIALHVTDQGPGIRQEDMPRLFGKFQKLTARPTGWESSTGLGLSIVKELVISLQGKISVASEEGKGATFTVEIPLEYQAA